MRARCNSDSLVQQMSAKSSPHITASSPPSAPWPLGGIDGAGAVEIPDVSSEAKASFNGQQLKISGMTVGYGGQAELFSTEGFSLECGCVYGVLGPNGVGKSSLAKLIASKTLRGFPESLSTHYLDPCATKMDSELPAAEYLEKMAEGRREELNAQIEALENQLEEGEEDDIESISTRLAALYTQEEELSGSIKGHIGTVLKDLGFQDAGLLKTPVSNLSSGWKMKCELASALLSHADLLVMDEPSFLDVRSKAWMVERIRTITKDNGAIVLLITHKERLLDELINRVLFINAARELLSYNCGYEHFVHAHRSQVVHADREVTKVESKQAEASSSLKRVQKQLAKHEKTNAKRVAGGEDKRFIQGKSVEAKQNADRSLAAKVKQLYKESDRLQDLAKSKKEHHIMSIPLAGGGWDASKQMVSLQDVYFSYNDDYAKTCRSCHPDYPVLCSLSAGVFGGDRIALAGANGEGKSTLLKLITGELSPLEGVVSRDSGLGIVYFAQDALLRVVTEHGNLTPSQMIQRTTKVVDREAREMLAKFGIKDDLSLRPVKTLSAGQRTRLCLAEQYSRVARPGLLILDEVENLDKDTTAALLSSVSTFEGAVLCVSHDEEHLAHLKPRQMWSLKGGHLKVTLTEHFS